MPERVQLSRRKGWRKPDNTVVVARPSTWGNPFKVGTMAMIETEWRGEAATIEFDMTPALAVELYRQRSVHSTREVRAALAGKNLACWCPLDQPCHADVLLEIANGADE
ncbi:MAG: DUF4326 domain-containing protein [Leifsonia sp.]